MNVCAWDCVAFLLYVLNVRLFPAPVSGESYNDVHEFIKDLHYSRSTLSILES